MATFGAVGEGKEKPFVHCFVVDFSFDGQIYLFYYELSWYHLFETFLVILLL
jgi:hypothetical protein